jgi:hypothetical protein
LAAIKLSIAKIEPTLKNKKYVIRLRNKMNPYSAMKIMANPKPLYSILNPDTSSLSPSAKSKGVRFSSANTQIPQNRISGTNRAETNDSRAKALKLKEPRKTK